MQFQNLYSFRQGCFIAALIIILALVVAFSFASQSEILENRKQLDRQALSLILPSGSYDNDLLNDTVLLTVDSKKGAWVSLELLGLKRNRLAYRARIEGKVVLVVVPATAEDGFNGEVDLLVAVDMFGRIQAVRVIERRPQAELFGVLKLIESQWLKLFSGKTFRDIQRLSWQTIPADNEYDLFVGASVTPKTVSSKIYDALVFFQSNRIAFMEDLPGDI